MVGCASFSNIARSWRSFRHCHESSSALCLFLVVRLDEFFLEARFAVMSLGRIATTVQTHRDGEMFGKSTRTGHFYGVRCYEQMGKAQILSAWLMLSDVSG